MLGATLAFELHHYLVGPYLARSIASAETPEAELDALCRANRWAHSGLAPGYSVEAFDADGSEFQPWKTGDWERVSAVTIHWKTGTSVSRALLDRKPLSCLFGE